MTGSVQNLRLNHSLLQTLPKEALSEVQKIANLPQVKEIASSIKNGNWQQAMEA